MKTQSSILFQPLTRKEIFELTQEVIETSAVTMVKHATKSFCSADLWNIQRRSKTATRRRQLV